MPCEIISEITEIETIAVESAIDEVLRLRKQYGHGRWRKLKGVAMIRLRTDEFEKLRFIGTKRMEPEEKR